MRFLRNLLLVLLLGILLWWVLAKLNLLPSLGKLFSPKDPRLEETPLVIQQIKPLAQLVTITTYTELTADTTRRASTGERIKDIFNPFSMDVHLDRKLVITGGVVINVGVDLKKLAGSDVFANGDSIHLDLPPAEILDVIVNPSATAVFLEEGRWSNEAVVALKQKIQAQAVRDIQDRGLLYQAEQRATEVLTSFFTAAGYKKLVISKGRLG